MTQWIRWWGLGVFAGVVAIWILCIDWVLERSIEFAGTQAVGAKVELDSASLSLKDGTLELTRLQVTNPDQPMQNLFEAARIHSQVDVYALLRRQFISDDASIEGLNLYTERDSSGAIEGRLFSFGDSEKTGKERALDLASQLNLPDVQQLADSEKARLEAEVDAMQNEIADIQQGWKQRMAQMPSKEKIAEYQRRWEELEGQNALLRVKGAKELRDDISNDLKVLEGLDDQIKADQARIAAITEKARTLPAREADRLLASVGLDQGFEGMIRHIIGEEAYDMAKQGLSLYQTASAQLGSGGSGESEASKPRRGTGEYIRFTEEQPTPQFLIKRASVDGSVPVAGQMISFSGMLNDITNEQHIWGKPMTLNAKGGSDTGASLKLDGLFDHRTANPLDKLDFDLRKLALSALQLSESADLPITLQKGVADIKTSFALDGNGLNARVDSLINQAKFVVAETAQNKTAELMRKALSSASQFDLNMLLSGNPDDPQLKLKSSLDKLIGNVLGAELKAKVAEQKEALQAKLAESIAGPTAKLGEQGAAAEGYRTQLDERKAQLKALLKDMR